MSTEPKFRRKVVATLVVKEAEKRAWASGYSSMNLHASKKGEENLQEVGMEAEPGNVH
jgi:hypothetical protein